MPHILVVDDSASIRAFLEHTLRQAGHRVTLAGNGVQGLAELQRHRFDLLITDIYMPEADGIETLRRAKALKVLPPTIAISAKDSIVNLLPAARMLGACHTLHKPFTADELLAAVAATLRHDPPSPPRPNRRT